MSVPSPDLTMKYTVVTSGRPRIDGTYAGSDELLIPTLDMYKRSGSNDKTKQNSKLGARGSGAFADSDSKSVNTSKRPCREPLDTKALANYCPRTTTFLNGRPCPIPAAFPNTPAASTPDSLNSPHKPSQSQGALSGPGREDAEDAASVDSTHRPRSYLRAKRSIHVPHMEPSYISHAQHARPTPNPASHPHSADDHMGAYFDSFMPELSKLSDSELLTLLEATSAPHPHAPRLSASHPHVPRPSALHSILQEMVTTGVAYTQGASRKFDGSASQPSASNPPSNNWSLHSEEAQMSHSSWSDAPSQNWRSPAASPSQEWLSWSNPPSSRLPNPAHPSHPSHPSRKRTRPPAEYPNLDFLDPLPAKFALHPLHPSKRPHLPLDRHSPTPFPPSNPSPSPSPNPFAAVATKAKHHSPSPTLSGPQSSLQTRMSSVKELRAQGSYPGAPLQPQTTDESTVGPDDLQPTGTHPADAYSHASALESKLSELRQYPSVAL